MPQDPGLLATLMGLVDTMVDEFDVIEFLHSLAGSCVDTLGVAEAGIMLTDSDGGLRYAASSHERMRSVELLELQIDEGPCIDTFRTGAPVFSASPEEVDRRWPEFGPHALARGFSAISAVPMRVRAQTVGALNLFSSEEKQLSTDDLVTAQFMADFASIGILHERALRDAEALSARLGFALQSRVVIEQAKGMLAQSRGVGLDPAFEMLRSFSRSHNRLLSDTARDVVDGSPSVRSLLDGA